MVRVSPTAWVSELETPFNRMVEVPGTALAATLTVSVCGVPAVRLLLAGVMVTPVGSVPGVMVAVPVKPLIPVREMEVVEEAPCTMVRLVGARSSAKSGTGGGATMLSTRFALCVVVAPPEAVKVPVMTMTDGGE